MISLFGRSAAKAASGHSAEPEPCCTVSAADAASVPNAVPPMSPARLLAHSLTSCETRDEWVREYPDTYGFGHKTVYRNEKRDLTVTRGYTYGISLYGGSSSFLGTPFTLNKDEEKIVCEALDAFNRRKKDEAEAAALHRLTASGTRPRK